MSPFWTYITGFVVLLLGLVLAAVQLGVETQWIVIGATVLPGIGIMVAVIATKRKYTPDYS